VDVVGDHAPQPVQAVGEGEGQQKTVEDSRSLENPAEGVRVNYSNRTPPTRAPIPRIIQTTHTANMTQLRRRRQAGLWM